MRPRPFVPRARSLVAMMRLYKVEVVGSIPTGPIGSISVPNPQPLSKDEAERAGQDGRTHRGNDCGKGRAESERRGRRQEADKIPRRSHQASEPHDQEGEEEGPDEEH